MQNTIDTLLAICAHLACLATIRPLMASELRMLTAVRADLRRLRSN